MKRNFKNIKAWQHAHDFVLAVYFKSKLFPKEELYGITSQLRRAAISIPSNIVEGANRQHNKEYLHFLYIAKASLSESYYLIFLSHELKYLTKNEYEELERLREETSKTLYGLIQSVKTEI